jgi:sulfide:quinone oxidoreductase
MHLNQINDALSVAAQITAADMAAITDAGFRSVICNRPDGESADQPTYAEIEAAAKAAGLDMRYIPVQSGFVRDKDALAFGAALRDLPKPVLAYCRSGARSSMLWSLWAAHRDTGTVAAE